MKRTSNTTQSTKTAAPDLGPPRMATLACDPKAAQVNKSTVEYAGSTI